MVELDLEVVRHALGVARKHGFAEVELSVGDDSFTATLAPGYASRVPAGSEPDTPSQPPLAELSAVRATLVGYYREAPTPLKIGQSVKKGEVVAVIEALGLANDVESPVSGEVAEILIQPGEAVQYGQQLALLRPL